MKSQVFVAMIGALLIGLPLLAIEGDSGASPEAFTPFVGGEPLLMTPACKTAEDPIARVASLNMTLAEAAVAPCDDLCACCAKFGHQYCCDPCAGCIEQQLASSETPTAAWLVAE